MARSLEHARTRQCSASPSGFSVAIHAVMSMPGRSRAAGPEQMTVAELLDGHAEAIAIICAWLDTWQHDGSSGPWWPQWIARDQLRTGRPRRHGPLRPSWCYGTPGITRAQQLAAIAAEDVCLLIN